MIDDGIRSRDSPLNMLASLIVAAMFIGMSLSVMVGAPAAAAEAPEASSRWRM